MPHRAARGRTTARQGMGCHRATLWRDQSRPPWKSSLTGMCECLSVGGALPALDRRKAEDALANTVYRGVPAPERELLALVHIMVDRGLVTEEISPAACEPFDRGYKGSKSAGRETTCASRKIARASCRLFLSVKKRRAFRTRLQVPGAVGEASESYLRLPAGREVGWRSEAPCRTC